MAALLGARAGRPRRARPAEGPVRRWRGRAPRGFCGGVSGGAGAAAIGAIRCSPSMPGPSLVSLGAGRLARKSTKSTHAAAATAAFALIMWHLARLIKRWLGPVGGVIRTGGSHGRVPCAAISERAPQAPCTLPGHPGALQIPGNSASSRQPRSTWFKDGAAPGPRPPLDRAAGRSQASWLRPAPRRRPSRPTRCGSGFERGRRGLPQAPAHRGRPSMPSHVCQDWQRCTRRPLGRTRRPPAGPALPSPVCFCRAA